MKIVAKVKLLIQNYKSREEKVAQIDKHIEVNTNVFVYASKKLK